MVKTVQGGLLAVKRRACPKRKAQFRANVIKSKIAAAVRARVLEQVAKQGLPAYLQKHGVTPKTQDKPDIKGPSKTSIRSKSDKNHNNEQQSDGCRTTISIAIPASIIDNAQSFELKTYLVSQIARAAAIYCVDEIIIIEGRGKFNSSLAKTNPTEFFVRNLEYLETPPYLRKSLFPVCPELKYSGLMNPLDIPHHFKVDEWSQFREGVVISRPVKKGNGSWVNTGFKKDCQTDLQIEEGTRVTVKFQQTDFTTKKFYEGTIVAAEEARRTTGKYWGYTVRTADNLRQ